jgi:uncharacterized protein
MIKLIILNLIKFYQTFISPLLGNHCRFYPSCSQYTAEIINRNGLIKGLAKGFKRILKCHPFHQGGVDLPY